MLSVSYEIILVAIIIAYIARTTTSSLPTNFDFMERYPTAHSKNNRLLGMVLSYNFGHADPLVVLLNEYQSMCEQGWDPTLIIFSTIPWSPRLQRYYRTKTFCYRTNASIPIYRSVYDPSIGTSLAAVHRKYLQSIVNDYDLFVYHEDDIIVRSNQVAAYLFETKRLYQLRGLAEGVNKSIVGFMRYRWHLRPEENRQHPSEEDIFNQEFYEETPKFFPFCLGNQAPYLHVQGNLHQAMWMMTRSQVLLLEDKCNFLEQTSPSREYMSSFSLYNELPWACGMNKYIPGDQLVTFSVLHYYPALHPSEALQVHTSDENIRAGYFPYMPLLKSDYYEGNKCWDAIIESAVAEQYTFGTGTGSGKAADGVNISLTGLHKLPPSRTADEAEVSDAAAAAAAATTTGSSGASSDVSSGASSGASSGNTASGGAAVSSGAVPPPVPFSSTQLPVFSDTSTVVAQLDKSMMQADLQLIGALSSNSRQVAATASPPMSDASKGISTATAAGVAAATASAASASASSLRVTIESMEAQAKKNPAATLDAPTREILQRATASTAAAASTDEVDVEEEIVGNILREDIVKDGVRFGSESRRKRRLEEQGNHHAHQHQHQGHHIQHEHHHVSRGTTHKDSTRSTTRNTRPRIENKRTYSASNSNSNRSSRGRTKTKKSVNRTNYM